MNELGIDLNELHSRMSFFDLTEKDVELLREMKPLIEEHSERLVAGFYRHLLSFDETRALLHDQATVDRLMKLQREYLLEIFQANFDEDYFERRLGIGATHHRIGLSPKWYVGAYLVYENLLAPLIAKSQARDPERGLSGILAVRKVFALDKTLALDLYFHRIVFELEEKIREMNDFTHVVSHDLKEPLRGIEAFSGFLLEDYSDRLDEEGRRYLQLLRGSALRMKDLIHDLLSLASLSRRGSVPQWTDVSEILSRVQQDLSFSIGQKGVEIRVPGPLPAVFADPTRMGEVFKNLLSNAIKFNHAIPPRVEVECKEEVEFYLFSIKDNGIGIEPAYQKQIFGLFERLHPQEEFEGTGAGLAICKKVVEGYGGRIWVESQPGQGSTFFFTLPRRTR